MNNILCGLYMNNIIIALHRFDCCRGSFLTYAYYLYCYVDSGWEAIPFGDGIDSG